MQNATTSIRDAVITAYQAASIFADNILEAETNPFSVELAAARTALEQGRANELKALETAHDRFYVTVMRQYEIDFRAAQNDNGQAFTAVLKAMDQGKQESDARYDEVVAQARTRYEQLCARSEQAGAPANLPFADELAAAIYAAEQERQNAADQRQAQYLLDKERLNTQHHERVERLTAERDAVLAENRTRYREEDATLRQSLESRLAAAQSAFDVANSESRARHQQKRLARLEIWNLYQQGERSAHTTLSLLEQCCRE